MTYAETIDFLYRLGLFGTRLGLENTLKLSVLAGKPQDRLRFVHVAGTNGKGSTCAMLESVYRAAGYRVGLFTSPHLVGFSERFQVNRQPIPEADVVRLVARVAALLESFSEGDRPTFFEMTTVVALLWFLEQECDLVVWETGLGGRLDATNIVVPLASVITNIQLDHQAWLGATLPEIAREKAGIIKPGAPVVTATDAPDAFAVIEAAARANGSRLIRVSPEEAGKPPLDRIRLPLLGEHQRLNAAVALATVEALQSKLPVSPEAIARGLSTVRWAGRLELVELREGPKVLFDGAHNPAGAETLRAALEKHFPASRPTFILGMLRDKEWTLMCRTLAPVAGRIFLAPVQSDRSALPAELETACREANPSIPIAACRSLAEAWAKASNSPFVVLSGSLHFIGEAMDLLKLQPSPPGPDERRLNEWNAGKNPAR